MGNDASTIDDHLEHALEIPNEIWDSEWHMLKLAAANQKQGDYDSSEMYKCDINNSDDITDRKICLLDKNDRDNCPQGWDFTGKFDSETYNGQSINICCKNT